MKMSDNYKVIEEKLKRFEPFTGNSMRGYEDERGNYLVISYNTQIAKRYSLLGSKELDTQWYSETTSKHQRLIARAWGFSPLKPKKDRVAA
jgi:hypothetical protein